MPTTQGNKKILDPKRWEFMTPAPSATVAGAVTTSCRHIKNSVLYLNSNTTSWLYTPEEDGWVQLPSPALAGTFGAGVGACSTGYSAGTATAGSLTATAGTTTTITTNQTIVRDLRGFAIHILSGPNAGAMLAIRSNTIGANSVITVDTQGVAFSASTVYRLMTPTYFVVGAGTLAAGSFRKYDWATNTWTSLTITGLPATIGTDGALISTPSWIGGNVQSTATAGGATTLTDSRFNWLSNQFTGLQIRILSGTGSGQQRTISSNTSNIITVSSAWTTNPDATSVYVIEGSGVQEFATGTATAGAASTITNSGKNWAVNQWANYQVRIISGTGAGQIRTIASNTSTVITVGTAWSTTPDTTSVYTIEGNDDFLYYLGNNAVTLYRYSISANTWSTLSPTAARAAAPTTGASANWVWAATESDWTAENTIINGKRIYSFRGGAGAVLDYYDIAANTWVSAVSYAPATETFTTGSKWVYFGNFIYGQKDATGRWMRYNVTTSDQEGWSTFLYPNSTAIVGNTAFEVIYVDGATQIPYVQMLLNTSSVNLRLMVI